MIDRQEYLENADWTKQHWDLPEIRSVEDLNQFLRPRMTIAAFKQLPIYLLNVERLAWLKDL